MAENRNRISITLTDIERDEVDSVASLLGIKSTRVVYECVKSGLLKVLESGQQKNRSIVYAQQLRQGTMQETKPDVFDKPKQKTNVQKKQEARKKKSR